MRSFVVVVCLGLLGSQVAAGVGASPAAAATPVPTTTTVTSSVPSSVYGQRVTLTANVSAGAAVPSGTVTFTEGSTVLGTATLFFGKYALILGSLSVGTHQVTATFGGNAGASPSAGSLTQVVVPAVSQTTLTSSANPSVSGQSVTLSATVSAVAPGAGLPTGVVTFKDGATTLGTATSSAGKYTLAVAGLSIGGHNLRATFAATASFGGSTADLNQSVTVVSTTVAATSPTNPAVLGRSVDLVATVAPVAPGGGTPTGTVTFTEGGATLGTATWFFGRFTLRLPSFPLGPHLITATYGGTATYGPSAATFTLQVVLPRPTLTVSSSVGTAEAGQEIVIDAAVAGSSPTGLPPTGSVSFADGATALGSAPLVAGHASITLPALTVGTHTLGIAYSGDANFQPVTTTFSQSVVPAASSVSATSSVNPSVYGSSVTLTATVAATTAGRAVPSGSFTFAEGTVVLGSVPVDPQGVASLALPSLPAGTHLIAVTYAGDSQLAGGSVTVTQVVQRAPSSVSVTSSANPAVSGQAGTIAATVTGAGGAAPTGTVVFSEGGTTLATATAFFGRYSMPLLNLPVGTHTIVATYGGSVNHQPSSATITQVVDQAATTVTISTPANPAPVLSTDVLAATIAPVAPATGTPTGTVTFSEGGVVLSRPTLFYGKYAMSLAGLSLGQHDITVTFAGTGNFRGSSASITQQIVKAPPKVSVASPANPSIERDGGFLNVGISSTSGTTLAMGGTVAFTVDGQSAGSVVVDGGRAWLSFFDFAPGDHTIGVTFSGNDLFLGASAPPYVQTVHPAPANQSSSVTCGPLVGMGDSRLMNTNMLGRITAIASGIASPLGNSAILADPPNVLAYQGLRYGAFAFRERVKAQKAACPLPRDFFTVLGPNHLLSPTYLAGDTQNWDPVDTAEMYALFDLMTQTDVYGPGGRVVVASFIYGPSAPQAARERAAAHDQAVIDYAALHPDRDVQLLPLDPSTIAWSGADWIHPTYPLTAADGPTGQDVLARQVLEGVVRLHHELGGTATRTELSAPGTPNPGEPCGLPCPVTLSARVDAVVSGGPTPTGWVSFTENGVVLGSVVVSADGRAEWSGLLWHLGTRQIEARFASTDGFLPSVSTPADVVVIAEQISQPYTGSGPRLALLGDSITARTLAEVDAALGADHAIGVEAHWGYRVSQLVDAAPALAAGDPAVVVINLGTDDIIFGDPPATTTADYERLVALFPSACIVVTTINSINVPAGDAFNGYLAGRFAHIADWHAMVVADPGLLIDGMHPSARGKLAYAELVRQAVADCPAGG